MIENMNQDHVTTSDLAFAAYLMLHDFTLITCVDPEDGAGRFDFYLTHSDPEVRDNIYAHMNKLRDKFSGPESSYSDYYKHTRKLRGAARSPIRKSTYGGSYNG